jgi:hypothetical protein
MISCRGVAQPVHWFCSCLRRSLISARPVAAAVLLLESLPPVLFDLPPGVLSVRIPAQVSAPVLSVPTKSFFSVARSALLFMEPASCSSSRLGSSPRAVACCCRAVPAEDFPPTILLVYRWRAFTLQPRRLLFLLVV